MQDILKVLGQYADDIDLYLYGKKENVQNVFKKMEFFGRRTGFKINYNKTTIYRIGSLVKSKSEMYTKHRVQTKEDCINVLGVNVSTDIKSLSKINYVELIKKAENLLIPWKRRGLTLTLLTNILTKLNGCQH